MGLQPSMLCTRSGALIVQGHIPQKPFPSPRIHYAAALVTVISRDAGATWTRLPNKPGDNGLNLEGGMIQLRDGTILALDSYVTPGAKAGTGLGLLGVSQDDWQTLADPIEIGFELPGVDFGGSTDDVGKPHAAQRLHRRILELPDGDLLTTIYGWFQGDRTPVTYVPSMMKSRVVLVRSSDRGRTWRMISVVAADSSVGTEGFGEAVLTRISRGKHEGRLLCFMRTGRELYECSSDDDGKSWGAPRPRVMAGLDVHKTELWADMFRHLKANNGRPLDETNPEELKAAVVDPDLIELRRGLLVAAFGLRVPQKSCWPYFQHPWNGNYLAFSSDQGASWSNVMRVTSGVDTTHYMAIEETPTDNEIYMTYDFGSWGRKERGIRGRKVKILQKS